MDFIPWKKLHETESPLIPGPGLPDFLCQVLSQRGCANEQQARLLLDGLPVLYDPMLLSDMDKAVARIRLALAEHQKILVYGDYDCDGVTATVMLYDYLENAGADILYYIPQREGEGYGLNLGAVEKIRQAGVQLVITVDNGISAIEEVALATSFGIDCIVTDHHKPKEQLPECVAVIDPHRADCGYPFKGLCGAGVAFKLICALEQDTEGLMLELYGDLLAVATMADIVPLLDENRYLVQAGLQVLRHTQRAGLQALAAVAGVAIETITGEQISFALAPRINVTGRIDSVDLAVELLLCQDEDEAKQLAGTINSLNTRRKEIEADIVAQIGELLMGQPLLTAARVLVVHGSDWHPGVIGITAARLVERYRKPCIILSRMANGELRGSARSVEGFSIIDAIHACGQYLIKYGGHPMAAGLSLQEDSLPAFMQALEAYSKENYPVMPRHCLTVDGTMSPKDITIENIRLLDKLQPFGCGNPQPVPVLQGLTLQSITPMGGGNHLRLGFTAHGSRVEVVCFSTTPESFPLPVGSAVDCAVSLSENIYQGVSRPSVRLVGLIPSGFPMEAKLRGQALYDSFRRGETQTGQEQQLFGRNELAAVFKLLRELSPYSGGADWLLHRLGEAYGYFRLLAALDILCELGLISALRQKGSITYTVVPTAGKANMTQAPTYQKLAEMGLTRSEQRD